METSYRVLKRRGLSECHFTLLAAAFFLVFFVSGCRQENPEPPGSSDPLTVQTKYGPVSGQVEKGTREFLGVPYAAPPVGDLRWRPPEAPEAWTEPFEATDFGKTCAQNEDLGTFAAPSKSEDCLYLNVFIPEDLDTSTDAKLPVMVWIYGGGLFVGESDDYDASKLVNDGNTVVVTFNYRLGTFGFFAHPSLYENGETITNYGILDQQFALQWVQDNIEAFGGDPDNVTIFGESAGGLSVLAHLASPDSKGLFHRGIIESGAYGLAAPQPTRDDAEALGAEFAKTVGCEDQTAACLRSVSVDDILAAGVPYRTGLSVDNTVIPGQLKSIFTSGDFNRVPLVNGANRDEYTWFVAFRGELAGEPPITAEAYPEQLATNFGEGNVEAVGAEYPLEDYDSPSLALAAALGDWRFICSARTLNQLVEPFTPVYAYEFADRTAPQSFAPVSFPYGAAHTSEIQYLFPLYHGATGIITALNPAQEKLSNEMVAYWTNFAAAGDPNNSGLPTWPAYTPDADANAYMTLLTPEPAAITDAAYATAHHCEFWDGITIE